MRALSLAFALIVAAPVWASPAAAGSDRAEPAPSNAPFRVMLVSNSAAAQRAAAKLSALARQPAPAKLSKADLRLYSEHTKWLAESAARLASIHGHMEQVLAKGDKAPITEVATTNMELVNARDAIEAEAKRFNGLSKTPARSRHVSALIALRADK
ncbi:MAG: hypothetical protein U0270_26510 [Labilithrix sp.]